MSYREFSYCSNAKSVSGAARGYRSSPKGGRKERVVQHTGTGSGRAVDAHWIAVVENYQQADGSIVMPEVLRP